MDSVLLKTFLLLKFLESVAYENAGNNACLDFSGSFQIYTNARIVAKMSLHRDVRHLRTTTAKRKQNTTATLKTAYSLKRRCEKKVKILELLIVCFICGKVWCECILWSESSTLTPCMLKFVCFNRDYSANCFPTLILENFAETLFVLPKNLDSHTCFVRKNKLGQPLLFTKKFFTLSICKSRGGFNFSLFPSYRYASAPFDRWVFHFQWSMAMNWTSPCRNRHRHR